MDSMRSLNSSLPSSTQPRSSQPPEQLLQAFKTAALSVTNLYKDAVSGQNQARQAGYQDALDDLLNFLDKENLGLDDGEGWQVRQWATERLDKANVSPAASDSDDERGDIEKRARSSSPVLARKPSVDTLRGHSPVRGPSPSRTGSAPPLSSTASEHVLEPSTSTPQHSESVTTSVPFTFTAAPNIPVPQDIDMQASDSFPTGAISAASNSHTQSSSTVPASSLRLEVRNLGSRSAHRHNGSSRHVTRPIRDLGFGAGTKRKLQFQDFFDISGLGNGKDSTNSGTKRSRFT